VPDRDPATGKSTRRHILFDVGNVLGGEGGADTVFQPVVEDILKQLDGRPLDLYVMTHEHLDHVQGLFYAASNLFPAGELKQRLAVDSAWLTASAAVGYYDTHPEAAKQKLALTAAYARIAEQLKAAPDEQATAFAALLANNNPRSTDECVAFLRGLAPAQRTHYVYRGFDTAGKHPFREARFEIWAPEEDTSAYYRTLLPMALDASGATADAPADVPAPIPPAGVDAGAFYDLVEARSRGFADNLLTIDRAANNTSVVLCMEWRGLRFLFPGDAELESWAMMQQQGTLRPVDFVKVSHHGSHNGTPEGGLLDAFLPLPASSKKKRRAVISTWDNTYSGIPHQPTNDKLRDRCTLTSTLDRRDRLYIDMTFTA
jgi:beta-lactamase superfamily II metal-dependent hydrolase